MSASPADLATVIVTAVLIRWWAMTAGNPHGSIEPSSAELAYLRSGPTLALLSSLAWLRAAGAVASSWNKQVVAIAPAPAGADPLGQAIHAALRSSAPWSVLALDPRVAGELNRVRRRLIWRGWLLREHKRRWMRALAIIPAAAWLGSLLFITDAHGELTWWQATESVLIAAAALLMLTTSECTHVGRRLRRRYRRQHNHLSPKHRPSWTGCDADQVALAVALFGTSALWAFDPDFAVKADLPLRWGEEPLPPTGGVTPGI